MKTLIFRSVLLVAMLFQAVGVSANAKTLNASEMSTAEIALAEELARTEVRADLEQNLQARMFEAAANAGDEPPLTPETRRVMAKAAYQLIAGHLAAQGIYISELTVVSKVEKLLDRMASWGLVPHAFTVGYMARHQAGIGMSIGSQFNFYIEKGILKLSSYTLYGAQAGFAAMSKIQFYVALCFGSCFGGDPNGWYVGTDVSASIGAGIDGFLEFGVDFTDALKAMFSGAKYTIRDLYESKAVYAGVGFDIGIGGGWSLDVFHYRMDFEKELSRPGSNPSSIKPHMMTQYQLRTNKK